MSETKNVSETKQVWQALDDAATYFGISVSTIVDRIKRQELKYGVHYMDIRATGGRQAIRLINIAKLEEYWAIPPHKR